MRRSFAVQTLSYGAVRGAPVTARLCIFLVGARILDEPALAALAILHALIDLLKVGSDFGLDTLLIRRIAARPGHAASLVTPSVALKCLFYLVGSLLLLLFAGPTVLAPLNLELVATYVAATLAYALMGIPIAHAQATSRVQRLIAAAGIGYTLVVATAGAVVMGLASLTQAYLALAACEWALLVLLWHRSGLARPWAALSDPWDSPIGLAISALPLALTMAMGIFYQRLDLFMIRAFLDDVAVGSYAVLQRFTEPAMFLLAAVAVTAYARFARAPMLRGEVGGAVGRMLPLIVVAGVTMAGGIFILAALAGFEIVGRYWPVAFMLAISVGLKGGCLYLTALLQAQYSFWLVTALAATVLVLQAVLLALLLPSGGMINAATALVVTDGANLALQLLLILGLQRRTGKGQSHA